MQVLFRTQSSIYNTYAYDMQVMDPNYIGDENQFHFDSSGYYVLAIATEYRGTFITMSKSKKDKKKFEKLIRESFENDKVDLTEYVFTPYGSYEDEDEKMYTLRFNKHNGYKMEEKNPSK